MSITSDGVQSFPAARILIGPLQIEEQGNVLIPFNRCTVVASKWRDMGLELQSLHRHRE